MEETGGGGHRESFGMDRREVSLRGREGGRDGGGDLGRWTVEG